MAHLPDGSNFFSSVHTQLQPTEIAKLFTPPVWRVRKCGWTDFEAISDFAEVIIESSDPVLIHGPVANVVTHAKSVIEPLIAAGLSGSFECYDEAESLIVEELFGTPKSGG